MNDIRVGAIVQLKSGGQEMTVSRIENLNGVLTAWCDWFEKGKNRTAAYPITSLQLAAS
jgi:uncharacterized protein YodC (DUF2158 family)